MSDLAKALMIAIRIHAGQVDKQGEPYLLHVLRVVEAVSDEAKAVAALHDVLEDGAYEGDEEQAKLAVEADLYDDQFYALVLLTRRSSGTYAEYIDAIAKAPGLQGRYAREVKLADLRDNLGRIPTDSLPFGRQNEWASLRRRYEKVIATLDLAG